MRFRQSTPLPTALTILPRTMLALTMLALATIAGLTGCSNGSHPLTVKLSTVASSLAVNSQTKITATVANDSKNGGVTWSCTPAATCGSFSATTTASGVATTYTAPALVASNVAITATSVTTPTIMASTSAITISGATLAAGSYVFSLNGRDSNSLYTVAGVFTVGQDGTTITAGEQDYADLSIPANDLINGSGVSTVTTTADGNLQITLVTCLGTGPNACAGTDSSLPSGGTEVLNGTVTPLNPNKALITEFDASATSSGELDLQNATAAATAPAGGYAFDVNGLDGSGSAVSIGGVFTVDGAGTISGTNSTLDVNDAWSGTTYQGETLVAGQSTVTGPGTSPGRVVITLDTTDFGTIAFAGYIVDSTTIRLVELIDAFGASTGGTAFSQGANTGTFTASSVAGQTYVVGLNGWEAVAPLQVAAQLTFAANGNVTGFMNYNDFTGTGPTTPSTITGGTWLQDPVTGRVTATGIADATTTSFNAQFYPDGNGNVTAVTMDINDAIGGRGFLQSAAAAPSGPYAMGATGWEFDLALEFDAAGPVTASGTALSFGGFADVNWLTSPGPTYPNSPVSGAFAASANGTSNGHILGLDVDVCSIYGVGAGCSSPGDVFVYYLIDAAGDNIAIETDTNQMTLGYFTQQ